jgi:O-antigen ligase
MPVFYLLIAVMPIVRHPLWSETQVGDLTLYKYLGIACLVLALVQVSARGWRPLGSSPWYACLFAGFGLLTIASFILRGPGVPIGVSPVGNWTAFLLLFFVTAVLLDSPERLRWTLLSLVGGVGFVSLHLVREWQNAGGMEGFRPGWVAGDPNYFALSAILVLPLAFSLASSARSRWERRVYLGCFLVTLFAFMLSGSRGGLVGLLASLALLVWRSHARIRFLAMTGPALVCLLLLAPTSPLARLLTPGHPDLESSETRLALVKAGLTMFQENFWTGIGIGNYKFQVNAYAWPSMTERKVAHNTYLEVAAELGIFGLILFLVLLIGALRRFHRLHSDTIRARDPLLHAATGGLEAGLLGAAMGLIFLSALHVRLLWFVVILSICLPQLAQRPQRERPRALTHGAPS